MLFLILFSKLFGKALIIAKPIWV